jgi:hypothetical protein
MSPRGNRTENRGHRYPVGGEESRGTIQRSVRIPIELYEKVNKKLKKSEKDFAEHVRDLLTADLKK